MPVEPERQPKKRNQKVTKTVTERSQKRNQKVTSVDINGLEYGQEGIQPENADVESDENCQKTSNRNQKVTSCEQKRNQKVTSQGEWVPFD